LKTRTDKNVYPTASRVERDVKFFGKLLRIEGTAGKVTSTDVERGHSALAVVRFDNDGFPGRILFNIHFAKSHAAFFQERFRPAAIGAPCSAVNGDGFHGFVLQG
jgi:hypothetical protein